MFLHIDLDEIEAVESAALHEHLAGDHLHPVGLLVPLELVSSRLAPVFPSIRCTIDPLPLGRETAALMVDPLPRPTRCTFAARIACTLSWGSTETRRHCGRACSRAQA